MKRDVLDKGKRARAACAGWICSKDEAGVTRRPPRGRTWDERTEAPAASTRLTSELVNITRPGIRAPLRPRAESRPSAPVAGAQLPELLPSQVTVVQLSPR